MIPASLYIGLMLFAGGCGESDTAAVSGEPVRPVSFAVFGNTGRASDDGAFFRLADVLNDAGIDFAVDLGNRLPGNTRAGELDEWWETALQRADSLGMPLYPVAGVNDVFDTTSDAAYATRFGPRWYSFRRNGVLFVVVDTGDGAYRERFGVHARIGVEQTEWLADCMRRADPDTPVVVFMHHPLWVTDPVLWSDTMIPLFKQGGVDLVASACDRGLADWGTVDGIRAVSTGCVAHTDDAGAGLFPHAVIVTVTRDDVDFDTITPDGSRRDGIPVDDDLLTEIDELRDTFTIPVLAADASWDVGETIRLRIGNAFEDTLDCALDFTVYSGTSWRIEPPSVRMVLPPGDERTVNIRIEATAPELGPAPEYETTVMLGDRKIVGLKESLGVRIPRQRTGEVVPVAADAPDIVPYGFDGGMVRIPVDVKYPDTCGRLIICSDERLGPARCIHISPLTDFRQGLNEFTWNGRDTDGNRVARGKLTYYIAAYNKEAPPTWVADGPPERYGSFTVERAESGLRAYTHTDSTLTYYRIGATGDPSPVTILHLGHILDGSAMKGYASAGDDRVYILTREGIIGLAVRHNSAVPLPAFGNNGYRLFSEYRGRQAGGISYADGMVYVGIGGGGGGRSPLVAAFHARTGELVAEFPLAGQYGGSPEPPGVNAVSRGLLCSHPVIDAVVCLSLPDGAVQWENEAGSWVVGADADGRSFSYHPGCDRFGFVYTNTFGYSARCGVLGPDGAGLFRVILTQLPGLRTGDIVPMVEGYETDGLYFVTRGGDRPYVFHIPYTIDTGTIVDQSTLSSPPGGGN